MAWPKKGTVHLIRKYSMLIHFSSGSFSYEINLLNPIDISIPVVFNGAQPNTYNVPIASAKTYEDGQFIGDVRRGGSCNFEEYRLIPHCNGTHTECVGHIAHERISVHKILRDVFFQGTLVTITPEKAVDSLETYSPEKLHDDRLITSKSLFYVLENASPDFLKALIIRTRPNDLSKQSRKYLEMPPPFFSLEAMEYIVSLGVEHLLVDIPSVDRTFDEGRLSAHHIFWAVPQGSHDVDPKEPSIKTITEMIFVPDEIPDGRYLTHIQIPNFIADAAPSRVFLYEVKV
ncbi:cyclase family protein [bacterium]|nr:cyclase family protein [bacterium]